MRKIVMLAFFFSGFSSLVLENVWVHQLVLVFGGTTLAIVTVLTAFMGGLALGSYIGGRVCKYIKRPVRVYGFLEAGVALYALLLPTLITSLPLLYGWLPADAPFLSRAFLRFILCLLLLLLPTTLMGATLPVLSLFVTQKRENLGVTVGLLYSLNTFGAVFGALFGGFLFLPMLGHHQTMLLVVGCLFSLALLLIFIGGKIKLSSQAPASSDGEQSPEKNEEPELDTEQTLIKEESENITIPATSGYSLYRHRMILTCIVLTGGVAMICQVLWSRALSMVVGSSTYAFTLILSTFLVGLAVGASIGAWLSQRKHILTIWISTLFLAAFFIALGSWGMDSLPKVFVTMMTALNQSEKSQPGVLFAIKAGIAAIPILLPTLCMGTFFPLVLSLYNRQGKTTGERVGMIYAANTFGSIVGSAIGGFIIIPVVGLQGGLHLSIIVYLLCACGLAFFLDNRKTLLKVGIIAVVGIVAVTQIPKWNVYQMSLGFFRPLNLKFASGKTSRGKGIQTIFYKEGINTTVAVQQTSSGVRFLKVNGKTDASTGGDVVTQVALGAIPLLLHKAPQDALIIGWGSGITVGGALQFPLRSVMAIELEPAVVEASKYFRPWNYHPLQDKRVQLVYNDGRNYLATTHRSFDVIVSEPSNPWISGVSNLFTVEFFEQVRKKLRPQGVFCQWLQYYEISYENFLLVLASVHKVFPHVAVFMMRNGGDTLIMGSHKPFDVSLPNLQKRFQGKRIKNLLKRIKMSNPIDLSMLYLFDEKAIKKLLKATPSPFNTDRHNILGYRAPFDLIRTKQISINKKFERLLKENYRDIYGFFFPNEKVAFSTYPRFWFGALLNLLSQGSVKRVIRYLHYAQAEPKPAPFIPYLQRLSTYMSGKGKAPTFMVPTKGKAAVAQTNPTTKGSSTKKSSLSRPQKTPKKRYPLSQLLQIQKVFQKNPSFACSKHILPFATQASFQKDMPPKLWFYFGSCLLFAKRHHDALHCFNQYIKAYPSKKETF